MRNLRMQNLAGVAAVLLHGDQSGIELPDLGIKSPGHAGNQLLAKEKCGKAKPDGADVMNKEPNTKMASLEAELERLRRENQHLKDTLEGSSGRNDTPVVSAPLSLSHTHTYSLTLSSTHPSPSPSSLSLSLSLFSLPFSLSLLALSLSSLSLPLPLGMCVFVCQFVCVCVCLHASYVCMHVHVYLDGYIRTYMHTYIHTCTHIHAFMHTCMHACTHTHTHTHTHQWLYPDPRKQAALSQYIHA